MFIASFDKLQTQQTMKESSQQGIGGAYIPVNDHNMSELASTTESNFGYLDVEMGLLLENLAMAKDEIIEYQEFMRVTPSIWPTISQRITSNFGYRTDPFTRKSSYHSGIDIGGDILSGIRYR